MERLGWDTAHYTYLLKERDSVMGDINVNKSHYLPLYDTRPAKVKVVVTRRGDVRCGDASVTLFFYGAFGYVSTTSFYLES